MLAALMLVPFVAFVAGSGGTTVGSKVALWAALARSRAVLGESFAGFDARWAALARSRAVLGESFAFAARLAARRSSFLPIIVATIVCDIT